MTSHIQARPGLFWVGARNPELRRFDVVMHTEYGTTYNAYLVQGDTKTALIETVKDRFFGEQLDRIRELIDVGKLDYIVLNHTEPDHSGALAALLGVAKNAQVLCTKAAAGLLKEIVNKPFECRIVNDGDSVDLGGVTLQFIMAPFLHWPDSMFTYIPQKNALVSGDVFGCHYSSEQMLESLQTDEYLKAQKYYFDVIMGPFKPYVLRAAEKIRPLGIDLICPSHGPVLDKTPWETIERYEQWAADCQVAHSPQKVFIGYVSCYGFTHRLGESIAAAIAEAGLDYELVDVGLEDTAVLAARANAADAIIVGSPTLNRDVLPPVWALLTSLSAISCRGKMAAAFGSYGWSGEACKFMEDRLRAIGCDFKGSVKTKLNPDESALKEAYEFGKLFAKELTTK